MPLSTDCLKSMLCLLHRTMLHNFFPAVMTISGTIMALHFTTFVETMPITLAYGSSGTGKTTALHCGLSLMGADEIRFFREVTPALVRINYVHRPTSLLVLILIPNMRSAKLSWMFTVEQRRAQSQGGKHVQSQLQL